jgi:hypothetical protein
MADLTAIENRLTSLEADLLACQTETEPTPPLACVAVLDGPQTSATITFTAPASDGGSAIVGYEAVSTPGGFTASGAALSLIVAGLDGVNVEYTFEVRASNVVGHSLPCVTAAVGTNPLQTQVDLLKTAVSEWVTVSVGSPFFSISPDAEHWLTTSTPLGTNNIWCVATDGNGHFVAGGSGGSNVTAPNMVAYSTNFGTWWTAAGTVAGFLTMYDIAYGGGRWVAAGNPSGGSTTSIVYSDDGGVTWTGVSQTLFRAPAAGSGQGNGIAYDGVGRWVAVGAAGPNTVAYSNDGATWTGLGTTVLPNGGQCAGYDKVSARWIVGGNQPTPMAYSDDGGVTWTSVSFPLINCHGIAHDGIGLWVATSSSTGTIAYSADGITWTTVVVSAGGTAGVATNGSGRWVAVGGVKAFSDDGAQTWTPVPTMFGGGIAAARVLP